MSTGGEGDTISLLDCTRYYVRLIIFIDHLRFSAQFGRYLSVTLFRQAQMDYFTRTVFSELIGFYRKMPS